MKIEIESRESVMNRAKKPFPAHTALISITDTDDDFVVFENRPEHLLELQFDDVGNEVFEEVLGREATDEEALALSVEYHMFDDEQAEKIAAFVKQVMGKTDLLICQCEYGQSRSAGVAAAIRQFIFGDGIDIFADDRYYPNKLVYRKVFAALAQSRLE